MSKLLTHPTTSRTLSRDLVASIALREGIPAGVTFGGFIAAMRVLGVQDEDRIASIEYGCAQGGNGRLLRDDAPDGIEIREGRS